MAGYMSRGPPNGSIYVCNLPPGTDETMLAEYFGTIGLLKKDKRTGHPKIWIYRDKVTNEPKGDATVTYEDPHAASAAVEWFNNKDFHGSIIQVHIAESKNKDTVDNFTNVSVDAEIVGQDELDNGSGRGRGRGDGPAKAWQQDGDWMCPNTSCGNVNFAFRGVCNRCGASRPAGVSGSGGGGGRGRGRGSDDARGSRAAAAVGGPPGLFGPNDWPCTMCGNVNWAKRTKCNVCNTSRPGHNEGGVRGGRGGGFKELDEEELEEVRRRRKEAEEDDGEMYDEFGNLKKKFRAKSHQTESTPTLPGSGRAGWEVEHRSTEREGRERSRDRGRDDYDERESKNRDRGSHGRERRRSRSRSRDREKERGRDRGRDRGNERSWERGTDRERDRYR
ncbi:transcription initiation factor TFIID subunit 15 isoform X2 [Hordeum vulgare subsp. vulgare]|uniref:transcription initiation factor TFIID subunit 15 isoform X2 n=1 Tax=Hordeum vulgare subsp. vulgare TaxID=112509 RepID=UPI0002960F43|nr:transcription initiation factor TFIID subunit 15 isoform X2 [Hordeum vulgare subsp. vulgare]